MKVRFNRWYNAVQTALLSMLGYSCSLDEPDEYGSVIAEYGVPQTYYFVKGQVTDEANVPVQGIKTSAKIVFNKDENTEVYCMDSTLTDEAGRYQLKHVERAMYLKLIVEDTDGEANGGEFLSDTLDIDFDKAVKIKEGDHHWNQGTYEISQDIKLKKKP